MPIQGVASDQFLVNPAGNGIVNSTTTGNQGGPSVTLLSDGRFVFVWHSGTPDTDTDGSLCVRARIYNADGTPQGSDFIVETTLQGDQFTASVSALADGHFVVTWTSTDPGDSDDFCVRGRIFDADDTTSAANDFIVNTTTDSFQRNSTATQLANGNFVVTWESLEGPVGEDQFSIRARLYDATGAAIGNDFLVDQTLVGIKETPRITAFGDGFIVTWLNAGEDLTSPAKFRARIFDALGNAGDDFIVNSTPSNLQGAPPTVATLSDGRFVIAWESTDYDGVSSDSQDGSETCVRARIFAANGTPIADDFIVNTTTDNFQRMPSIVGLADGRFVVAWASFDAGDGSGQCIRARVYNVDGSADGNDFVLNFVTASEQFAPFLQALPDGRFVATWESSDNGDASNDCLRAQFFDPKIFTGTADADIWKGGNFADQISGDAGADTLTGGLGKDLLTGGADADIFDFNLKGETPKGASRDIITDFQHGIDDINLRDVDAKSGVAGNQNFHWIGGQHFHHIKGELHFVKHNLAGTANDKTIVEGDVNGDGHADFQIELTGLMTLSKGDFVL